MRHRKKFNHLGRKTAHRKAMLANMACSLIEHKRINTTLPKAKAVRQFVEPLITIYEPKAYPILLSYLAQGYSCPRKVLINSEVEIIEVDDNLIRNINTPEEYEEAVKEIQK